MKYKLFFHRGDELSLKTTVARGEAWVDDMGLHVVGSDEFTISSSQLLNVEMFRLHGLGRVIRVEHNQGCLFLSVTRLMIGQFALINFSKTGTLYKALASIASLNLAEEKAGD
jgi:hypothetical protein